MSLHDQCLVSLILNHLPMTTVGSNPTESSEEASRLADGWPVDIQYPHTCALIMLVVALLIFLHPLRQSTFNAFPPKIYSFSQYCNKIIHFWNIIFSYLL